MDIQQIRNSMSIKKLDSDIISYINIEVINQMRESFPNLINDDDNSLPDVLERINCETGKRFVVIIDEWDCIFRTEKDNVELQENFMAFLSAMFKGVIADGFIKLAYITGILPIKKYGHESALNNFDEYTMVEPFQLAPYVGFTEDEVKVLCEKNNMDFEECKLWYNGYTFEGVTSVYSPNSVMQAVFRKKFRSYWTTTETYESLKFYIDSNYENIREDIVDMLSGKRINIDPETFQNDLVTITCKDDVFTLLVHLGYLAYESFDSVVYIPNKEVRMQFVRALKNSSRTELAKIIKDSDELLKSTLQMDEEAVAEAIEKSHNSFVSPKFYNNEQALRSVILNAYISRVDDYVYFQELPSGKGFADILFYPRKGSSKPALLIELKWNKSSDGAIKQIHEKHYVEAIKNYGGEILLIGINYDSDSKKHSCLIEKFQK
jgi:predicted CopG family antitoxin